jgi:quercetin dioxygenase-like cupin family protein
MKTSFIAVIMVLGIAALVVASGEKGSTDQTQTAVTQHHPVNPSDLKWGDMPPGLPAGGKMAVLNGDPGGAGTFTVRLNAPAGYTVPPHTHPTAERLTVLSGSFRVGMGDKMNESSMHELGPGGYVVLPSGMAHFAKAGADSIVQIDSEGPFQINYVNPNDDPRNTKK